VIYIATFKFGESVRTEIRIGALNLEEAQEKAAAGARERRHWGPEDGEITVESVCG